MNDDLGEISDTQNIGLDEMRTPGARWCLCTCMSFLMYSPGYEMS